MGNDWCIIPQTSSFSISIHVPAWGTTTLHFLLRTRTQISIHVPAWGTTWILKSSSACFLFQSTFPRGERRVSDAQMAAITDFNPRSRVGNDGIIRDIVEDFMISIHVPAWGTTQESWHWGKCLLISIHVPAWGTTDMMYTGFHFWAFQSTFPRGERQATA